jgi:hypothetical protein
MDADRIPLQVQYCAALPVIQSRQQQLHQHLLRCLHPELRLQLPDEPWQQLQQQLWHLLLAWTWAAGVASGFPAASECQ